MDAALVKDWNALDVTTISGDLGNSDPVPICVQVRKAFLQMFSVWETSSAARM
jgi:hypothetical protein